MLIIISLRSINGFLKYILCIFVLCILKNKSNMLFYFRLAEEVDMKLLFCKRFEEYFEERRSVHEGQYLLSRMQVFEVHY